MSTMIEKISRALAIYQSGNADGWKSHVPVAKLMLDAMRDPTEEMWGAVVKAGGLTAMEAAEIYTAMIDGARGAKAESSK